MSEAKKAIRERFRSQVMERDAYQCVVCGSREDLEVHHIVNRNLMANGGYYLTNGVTLCPQHHFEAEAGALTETQLKEVIA
jgi:5-methylcytosine-specific restriction endonuclease McrA